MNIIQNILLLNLLKGSNNILLEAEKQIKKELLNQNLDLILKTNSKNFKESLKANFFSLLMISILKNEKIEYERLVEYTKIIIHTRQIITSTDNIIDKENKGIIFSKSLKNLVVANTLINLYCKNSISKSLSKLGDESFRADDTLLKYIDLIAVSESKRDVLEGNYPSSNKIIDEIHSGIGGRLLELSLIAPIALESGEIKKKLQDYSTGLYWIGMALQELDDFFDMKEDYENEKYNLYTGKYLEKFNPSESDLVKILDNREFITETFSEDLKNVKINTEKGLNIFKDQGFPIGKSDFKPLLKELFKIRGLKKEFSIIFE